MYKSLLISAVGLLALVDQAAAAYSADLKCGKCIKEGYNFCFVGTDTQTFEKGTAPEATCCQDTSCAQASDSAWSCSGAYSDADYALTFCPFKKDKCGDTAEVTFENTVNATQQLTVSNLAEGETCSFKIKSKCNSPGFKKTSSEGMDDSNTEVSFIEYKKSFVNATEKDSYGSGETKESKKTKMPSDDKPPRNQSWSDMGMQNKTKCKYNYSVPADTDTEQIALNVQGKAKVSVTSNANNTLTIEICYKAQFKPKRKNKNGTYTEKEDMEDAKKEHWDEYSKEGGPAQKSSVDYIDETGVHTVGKQKGPKRQKDEDGWDGKTYDGGKTDWGKSYEDKQYESNPEESTSESGYGKPSKGTYSSELGGYKSFGTEGQGDSSVGTKDTNDTTCGDRVVLLKVTALNDTSDIAATTSSTSGAVHPVVKSSTSHMTFEVGSYSFYDDLAMASSEDSASVLKTSWMLLSMLALFMVSFTSTA